MATRAPTNMHESTEPPVAFMWNNCSAVVQLVAQKLALVGRVDGHTDGPELVDREPGQYGFDVVVEHGGNTVALDDAALCQAVRQARGLVLDLGIGEPVTTEVEEDAVRELRCRSGECGGHRVF